jgi:hypothetical protein
MSTPATIRLVTLHDMLEKVSSYDQPFWVSLLGQVKKYCNTTFALEDGEHPWIYLCYINAFTRVRLTSGKWQVQRCDCWCNPRTDLPTETFNEDNFFLADQIVEIVQKNR